MNSHWIQPDWPGVAGVRGISTTRTGGVSVGSWRGLNLGSNCGDEPENVNKNRGLLGKYLPTQPVWLSQVHGTGVYKLDRNSASSSPQADAVVTREAGLVCAVLTADCLPVLFCNKQGTEVAAAHAGWRGLCAGVLEETVRAMSGPAAEIQAWFGPAIGPGAYEVGDEVRQAFLQKDPSAGVAFSRHGDRCFLDLYTIARQRLEQSGIRDISGGSFCTLSEPDRFFSYRRDGATGRMASLVWLEHRA